MRRVIMVILTTIIYAMFFISCSNISNIKSTELNNIFIDNLNIGSSIKKINLNKYTESNAFLGDYMCKFEEIIIDSKNNKINYLFGKFDENRIVISVNDKRNLNYIDEIKQILGDNYKEKWKDREQNLKEYIYFDKINNIKAEFVYVSFDESLVWIILSKINS
ncbi:hypothetical protein [uncultured Clostridium sp.]|uniref:hypothetical protein n=1 Tax=uncultured Clostridium sp. TaxID=59620 RepID=UPI0025F81DD7|nr:hypothetical protein [uncultured Clostridium sp.]MDU4326253.1 hypothetical protein [Clostridium celatum]